MKKSIKKSIKKVFALCLATTVLMAGTAAAQAETLEKTSLTANQISRTAVKLSWKKIDGADGYQIFRKEGASGTFKKLKTVKGEKALSLTNIGLSFGQKYYYKVRAYDRSNAGLQKGSFSSTRVVRMTNIKPVLSMYIPAKINETKKTITLSVVNSSKNDTVYMDGVFAVENLADNGRTYNARPIRWEKPELNAGGAMKSGSRIAVKAGEKIRFVCVLDEIFDYQKSNVRLTTVVRHKRKDFVSVQGGTGKNKVYTEKEYYDYLMEQ